MQKAELHRVRSELARADQKEAFNAECFIKDSDGVCQYISRAFERRFGVDREGLIGQDDAFVLRDENA